jgi:enamine deaminase RidA (YjgF/YER057c/UK114 family)
MGADQRVVDLNLILPPPPMLPPGVSIPFEWVRVSSNRVLVSGHGALDSQGAPAGPFGRVPTEVPLADAQSSARAAAVAMLASLQRSLGTLDRIGAWLSVSGFVNTDDDYPHTTAVVNPFSELVLDVFGTDVGAHARTAIGVRALPLNLPVVVAAEVEIDQ